MACGILVPQPGLKPAPPTREVWSLNHWTTREVPKEIIKEILFFLIAKLVKNLPAMQETLVRLLGWEDPLEKG